MLCHTNCEISCQCQAKCCSCGAIASLIHASSRHCWRELPRIGYQHRGLRQTHYPRPPACHAPSSTRGRLLVSSSGYRAAQKCALDLPALLLDPVFENRLVFWLRNTRITPNQVTVFTGFTTRHFLS